jgi:hypothetical protein
MKTLNSFLTYSMGCLLVTTAVFATFDSSPEIDKLVRNLTLSGVGLLLINTQRISSDD